MTKPAKRKTENKRTYLIEQATRCLSENGYAHVSLRDIARESGVSLGILHYYFSSKEELLVEVIHNFKEHFIARLEENVLAGGPLAGWLERLLTHLHQSLQHDWKMHRLWYDLQTQAMYHPVFQEQVMRIRSRFIQLVERMIVRLSEECLLHTRGRSPASLSPLLFTLLDGLFFQAILAGREASEDTFKRFEQMLLDLLEPYVTEQTIIPILK
jgi:AcrR family transcriptional regulator